MTAKRYQYLAVMAALVVVANMQLVLGATTDDVDAARRILEKADQIRFPNEGFEVEVRINTATTGQSPDVRK